MLGKFSLYIADVTRLKTVRHLLNQAEVRGSASASPPAATQENETPLL